MAPGKGQKNPLITLTRQPEMRNRSILLYWLQRLVFICF